MKPWKATVTDLYIVPQALVLYTVYKTGFLPSYHPLFFANATLQYNSSSIFEIKLWEAAVSDLCPTKSCFAVLHINGWISPILHCLWRLFLASYNLTTPDKLASSEVA